MTTRALLAAALSVLIAACGGATEGLPPHGEVLVVVDTDLPVPQLASRLRVDLYGEDGRWFESRDIGRHDPRDWPASFSVFSDDDDREKTVLVRIRVYPEGITRDYRGERFETRPTFVEPPSARTIEELCANPPELVLGSRLSLRLGTDFVTDLVSTDRCAHPSKAGAAAAKVTISTQGRYRFYVADALPYSTFVALALRRTCTDPSSQLECQVEPMNGGSVFTPGHFPRFDVELDPGTYVLVATGVAPAQPSTITLEGMPTDTPLPAPETIASEAPPSPEIPRLLRNENDETPRTEPLPTATVDRLLSVRITPGSRRTLRVTLAGTCAGTMARLGKDPLRPDARTAETCIDRTDVRVPISEAVLEEGINRGSSPTVQGTFARGASCDGPLREDVACIPAGAFLFGSRLVSPLTSTRATAVPERIATISRFYLDKQEVSVGRFRAAVARGFTFDPVDIGVNDKALPKPGDFGGGLIGPDDWCTWSTKPIDREGYALSCVNWRLARAFCRFEGGDLPTEAQWEYAASAAGRTTKVAFPWGDEEPSCEVAALMRGSGSPGVNPRCETPPNGGPKQWGPILIAATPARDVTPQGVIGLGGNLQEWALDSAQPYANDCWRAAPLADPQCWEEEGPTRVARGGCWVSLGEGAAYRNEVPAGIAARGVENVSTPTPTIGFRCAYAEPPR